MYRGGVKRDVTVWEATFNDGTKIEVVDASRAEAFAIISNSTYPDKHGMLMKLENVSHNPKK